MRPWRRPWLQRVLDVICEAFDGPAPAVVENSLTRTRRLQRRAAREASRNPFRPTKPRLARGPQDRGFQ